MSTSYRHLSGPVAVVLSPHGGTCLCTVLLCPMYRPPSLQDHSLWPPHISVDDHRECVCLQVGAEPEHNSSAPSAPVSPTAHMVNDAGGSAVEGNSRSVVTTLPTTAGFRAAQGSGEPPSRVNMEVRTWCTVLACAPSLPSSHFQMKTDELRSRYACTLPVPCPHGRWLDAVRTRVK